MRRVLDITRCHLEWKRKSAENNQSQLVSLPFCLLWCYILTTLQSHLIKLDKKSEAALVAFDCQFTCNWYWSPWDTDNRLSGYHITRWFIHFLVNFVSTMVVPDNQSPDLIEPHTWKFMQHKDTHMRTGSHTESTLINIMCYMPSKA